MELRLFGCLQISTAFFWLILVSSWTLVIWGDVSWVEKCMIGRCPIFAMANIVLKHGGHQPRYGEFRDKREVVTVWHSWWLMKRLMNFDCIKRDHNITESRFTRSSTLVSLEEKRWNCIHEQKLRCLSRVSTKQHFTRRVMRKAISHTKPNKLLRIQCQASFSIRQDIPRARYYLKGLTTIVRRIIHIRKSLDAAPPEYAGQGDRKLALHLTFIGRPPEGKADM